MAPCVLFSNNICCFFYDVCGKCELFCLEDCEFWIIVISRDTEIVLWLKPCLRLEIKHFKLDLKNHKVVLKLFATFLAHHRRTFCLLNNSLWFLLEFLPFFKNLRIKIMSFFASPNYINILSNRDLKKHCGECEFPKHPVDGISGAQCVLQGRERLLCKNIVLRITRPFQIPSPHIMHSKWRKVNLEI